MLLIPGLDKDLAGARTGHENCSFLTLTGMAIDSLVPGVAGLKISIQIPKPNPNPSEDHEADGLSLAKTGLEPISIIHRIMIDLDALSESTAIQSKVQRLLRNWSSPRRTGNRSAPSSVNVRWMLRSEDGKNLRRWGLLRKKDGGWSYLGKI